MSLSAPLDGPAGIILEVTDTGCGIPAVHQKEISGEFVTLDTGTSDDRGGLGLGPAIVERMAGLLVEDDPEVAEATASLLQGWGCLPRITDAADHAIAACTENGPPDLILSDYRLQGPVSGVEVVL